MLLKKRPLCSCDNNSKIKRIYLLRRKCLLVFCVFIILFDGIIINFGLDTKFNLIYYCYDIVPTSSMDKYTTIYNSQKRVNESIDSLNHLIKNGDLTKQEALDSMEPLKLKQNRLTENLETEEKLWQTCVGSIKTELIPEILKSFFAIIILIFVSVLIQRKIPKPHIHTLTNRETLFVIISYGTFFILLLINFTAILLIASLFYDVLTLDVNELLDL